MGADTRKKIYDILKNKTGFRDSYEDFSSDLSTSEDARKKVFEVLRDRTGFTDSYDNFVKGISDSEPVEEVNQVTTVQAPSYTQKPETRERILNNIPDYFKSRGNDLSTLPLPQNTMSAEKPADVVGRISQDEQQRIQLAERAANDHYMRQQELEHVFKPKNQEQIDNVRQLINTARQQRVNERQQRVKSAGGGGLFSTMSQAYLAGEQNDTDKELEYASTLLDQAQNITNEAKKKGKTNFFAGFARGFKDAPLDGWAMGLQDLKNYSVAKKVMDKVDKGEELSPSEDALMQALVTNAATQMYYSGDLGRGYKAGGVTAESLPFMLDMIAGMGTIQAVTKPASKALVKYASEKAAKYGLGKAATGLAKGAARTVTGLGDVAAHTATFGNARLAADYQRRGLGDVQVKPNEDGTTSYDGRENVQTGAEAIAKSAISTAAETGTELLGEYFAPILGWVGKATGANRLGKIIPASVGKAYSSLVNSNGFKQVQEIASRAKIADPIGEYGEEVVNNLISTAIGDMTPEQLVDLDQNIDTFLGVAPVSVLFGAVGTGGYLREKYKNYRNMREFENEMRDTMGEDWSGVKEALQDADIETARGMVKDVLASDMQPDMKKKAINYISTVLQEQTLQEMDKQMQPEEMARNKRNILLNLNATRNATGMSEEELNSAVNAINNEGEQVLPEMGYDQDSINKILDYKQAYDDYLNYTYWVQNQAYDARKQAEAQVQSLTNATTGTVMRVNAAFSKTPVNILRGNIVFDADGNVDRNQSDDTIYYLAEDGKVKMAPITSFDSLVDDSPAEDVAQQAGNDAEEEVLQSEEAQINLYEPDVQPIEVGTTFQNDGVNYEVTQKTADGYIVSAMDADGNPMQSQLLTEEQVRNAISPVQETQAPEVQEEQPVQETASQPEQQTQEQQTAMSRIPVNENGEQDFESAPYQDTSAALMEISDNVDDAKDTATQMVNHYQEELKKAEKAKTTGNTIQEIVRLKQEKKANIQSINDKIAYWNSVANEIESIRPGGIIEQAQEESNANQQRLASMTPEQQQAAQEEVQRKIDSGAYERKEPRKRARYVNEDNEMGTANTPLEHVLREIATGRVTFTWNDSGETQGLGSHLGLASSPEERRRMIWALSSDGMTPEAAAEQIHADMPENLQGMVSDQDVFNMILESFQQYGTPSKMWEAAKSMHGADLEESAPGYDDYMEQQALEWESSQNNMSVEEWQSYCDYIEEELDNMYSSVSDEDLNAIFEKFNAQIISENESRGNETEGAGSTEGQTDGKQSDELLPEGRVNNEGTDATGDEQPESANQADGEVGSVVPESEGINKNTNISNDKTLDSGYTVEKRYHKKDNKDIYAVNFTERMDRADFLEAKKKAKEAGGYYSSFGKGGFIFDTEEDANNFGKLIMSRNEGLGSAKSPEKTQGGNSLSNIENIRREKGIDFIQRNFNIEEATGINTLVNEDNTVSVINISFRSGAFEGNVVAVVAGEKENELDYVAQLYDKEGKKVGNELFDVGTNSQDIIKYVEFGPDGSMYQKGSALQQIVDRFGIKNPSYQSSIETARQEVDQNPTESQKEAGNYRKGHITIDGYNITIENPKGSERSGTDKDGNKWSVTMNNDYGYIRGTEGVDGDHIDVFLSYNPESGKVFVVDQLNEDGTFDEHKVMYGFDTRADAIEAYLANYSPGWTGLGDVTEVTKDQFKKWIDSSHRKTKPFAEYKSMITPKKPETVNGYKKGDKVMYHGKSATIYDFEYDGRPILDTGLAPVIYTVAEWEDVTVDASLITGNFGKTLVNKAGDMEIRIGKYDGAKQAVSMKINGDVQTMPVREAINMLNTDEWSEKKTVEPKKVSVESIIENLNKRGQTKLSENVILSPIETAKQPLQAEIDKRQKELADIKSGKKPNTVYGNGSNRSNLLEGEIREYKSRINNLDTLSSLKTGVAYEGKEGKKITIVSENNGVYKYQVEIDGHTVDLTANTEQMSNVVGLEHLSPERTISTASETAKPLEPAYGSQNKVVSTARYEELRKKLRSKLNNLNAGYDPELLQIGAEMAAYHVEAGARKFADFAKRMLADIGEEIRPYLKLFYNAVREFPGMESYEVEMDPYEEVRNTDINSIKIEEDEQTEANTETIVSEAETVASKAEADAERSAEVKKQRLKEIDDTLEKVNNQLALLGYYEADTDSPFHEAYGYAKSAEKKALADAKAFAKKLQKDLGVSTLKFESKRRKIASANIAPAGGDITLNIPLRDNSILAMYIPMDIEPGTDNMYIRGGIMYRIEHGDDYTGETNHYINEKSDYPTMLNAIRSLAKRYLPEQQTDKPVSVPVRKAKKAESISPVGDLFAEEKEVSLEKETVNTIEDEQKRGSEKENLAVGTEPQQEDAGPDRERMDTGSTGSTGIDQFGSGRAAVVSPVNGTRSTGGKRNERNNRNERGIDYAPKSPKARFDANVKAIRLMRKLIADDAVPTREQMQVLRKFSGWGGLGGYFNNEDSAEYKTLRELLSDEEFDAAANSINSAYYTPAHIIDTLWDVAAKLGFKGGNILEGSAGIGNIIGSMPVSISENSNIEAVEIDPITGNILKLLYPDAKVNIQGFEDTRIRNGSVDLAITNVPFVTGLQVHDPIDKDLSRKFRNIHDFCIAKNVRKLREGGIGIFITSSGTMDKSTSLREWLVNEGNADFVGAFRLNNKTFEGASVTSDIIVIRKRVGKAVSPASIDAVNSSIVRTGEYPTGEKVWDKKSRSWVPEMKQTSMELNNYFQQHPENMAGEMAFAYEKGETRYPGSSSLYPAKGKNQDTMLSEWADSFQPLMEKEYHPQPVEEIVTDEKNGYLFADENGNFFVSEMGVGIPLNLNANKVRGYEKTECLADYNVLKSALNDVLSYQVDNQDDKGLEPLLHRLNEAYDNFTKKYGSLNKNVSISFLRNDVDFPSVAAIEDYKEYKNAKEEKIVEINKTEVFRGRVIGFQAEPQPKTVKDGVIASIYKFGHIDLNYISDKLGMDMEQVKNSILNEGLGFVNPETGAVDVRYEYLSGNVRKKLEQARENNQNGEFSENIKALEKVIPLDIPAHLIDFSLGSSWLDPQLYIDYIKDIYGVSDVTLNHVEGLWNMKVTGERNEKNRAAGVLSEKFNEVIYGTELVEAALNNRTIQVKKVITNYDKSKETVVDKEATQACMNRIEEIKDEFKEWMRNRMLQDEDLAAKVVKTYNDKFNALVPVVIDEMFLPAHFGGSSESINLYTHQKRAVIRGTTEPLLLAHEVGSGKTFTLISTAMEMRRLGTAKKPMIVVQNATVGQFVADAKKLYPNAKILTISERDRTPEGRRAFYGRIKYSDWDLIIVPQSTFEMIPDSPERQLTFIQERIDEKIHALEVMREIEADEMQIQQMENELVDLQFEYLAASQKAEEVKESKKRDRKREEKSKQNIAARAKEQLDRKVDEVEFFDQMGVDAILIDEAHEYKRLGFSTAMTRGVKGIDPSGSKKAAGVYLKTRVVLEQNGWKNVVFATGTPISNTAAEIWTFMRYLMPKSVLKENEIYYFDDFVRNFGSISQSLEFTTSGKFKENSRFASYINKPELIRLWSSVSDTVLTKEISYVNDKIPSLEKGQHQDIFLPQSDSLISIMRAVREKLEQFENMSGKEKRKNSHIPLTMYGIAKRAAIDTRLVDANAPDEPVSKTNKAVEETLRTLEETKDYKGTVAIFCDNQRRWDGNKVGFDLFEDIRDKLIARGVPSQQIVIMKPGMSVNKKQKIFDEVNAGSVRVVIGNTQTLGTGVNIQERLHTLIHMDAPDRPMDYTQRNGRILRQGNLHKVWGKPVRILRFGVEDSLDVTSYQRLKTKAAFIDSIMDGKAALANNQENRTLEEEEEGLFDNPVAILSGSQYALLKNQAEREYRKFLNKKSQYETDQIYVVNRLARNKGQINSLSKLVQENAKNLSIVRKMFPDGKSNVITIEGKKCRNSQDIEDAVKELINKKVRLLEDSGRKNANFGTQKLTFDVKFDNLDTKVNVTLTRVQDYDYKLKMSRVTMHRYVSFDIPQLGIEDYGVLGGYARNAIDDITENVITGEAMSDSVEKLTSSINTMEEENNLLEQRKGKPFEFENELSSARDKVDEYTELMKEEMREKEAKYANRGGEEVNLEDIEATEQIEEETTEENIRFREIERSIVDPFINELMMRFQGEDISRYPYVDVRKDPDADYEVYWAYSEPLYKGKNVMDSPEVPELIKDRIRNDEYEIDKRSIVDWLEGYIDFNVGYEEAEEGQKVLDWFKENMKDFKMSDKVNLIVEKGDFPDTIYRENGENSSFEGVESDVKDISEKMNIPVQVITSTDQITDQSVKSAIESGRKIKGWFSVSEGKVYVYLPNASGIEDIKQTILHEGVSHYGLRKLVGDERMDDFLDDVFNNVSSEVRKRIVDTLPRYGYDSRVATEEYMARMAENGVDVSVWERIKQAFKNLLRKMGINININDNELRYILWRSRNNLENGNVIDYAKDVAMQYKMGVGNYFREEESDGSREEYERSLQGWKYKAREAYQDSMLALKNLQEVIAKVSGKPIKSFEDAYTFENQLSSKNTSESEKYYDEFFVPLLNAEGKLIKKYGLTHKAIERYMMLAHGIERNVEMTFREQLNEIIKENPDDAQQFIQDFKDEKEKLRAKYSGYEYLKELSDYMGEVGDFSATEAILKSMDNEEHADFQNDALDYVKDFEDMYDVKELWEKTNNATKETLKKSYESGMMDKDHFANVSKMFMYYVPLRGWTEDTAEDVYEYINSERNPVNSVLRSMKGRKSVPDEVIATIGNMAESSILQGNRNLMKQAFMNMVVNHPTDVATLRKAWYVYDPVKDEWSISMPEIEENDTPETIAEKIKNHEEKMKQLEEQGLATRKSKGLNIDYRIMKNNISQHAVIVKNGGKDFVIYVNGNPRAAQAVNGLTNPDAEKNPIFNAISRANRWLAANFTTRNPAFVMSNLSRDLIFSTTAVWIKEDAKYSSRFRKNILTALPTVVKGVMGKGKNSEADKYFREFVENGGETGYMYLHDVDAYKKKVRKELARITGERGSAKRAMDYTLERLEDFNRMAEDISRFAVYMTSRQMGRSIVESVRDAKEITVNFNKKGAGYKTGGFFGLTAGAMRNLYLFFNASVQSLTNFNRLRIKNPVKFYSALGGFMTAGMLIPVVNNLLYSMIGGGDDNPYNDLPEWVRRNNLCIYAGNGQFLTLPLPIELRAFYGLGDYAYQLTSGREKLSPTGLAKGTVSQLADLLPLNPTGNEGFKTFVPDALAPVFETYVWNKDFTGKPIAKLTPFNERDPEWKRVYKGTSGWLVDASKFFNDLTNGGGPGSDFRKGVIDFNPAKVENLLESYFGGMAKFLNQSGKTIYYGAKSIAEGEMDDNMTARNVPVLNRFYNSVDDRNAFAGVNTDYFKLRDEMEQFKYELNGVKKNYHNNPDEYRQMVNSDMFRKYMKFKPYQDLLDRLYKIGKETEGEERKQIEDKIIETRREVLKAVK